MALDLKRFRMEYPEYDKAPDTVVSTILARASTRTPADIWGTLEDEGHGLLTAHLLALRPEGKEMRLKLGDGTLSSIYWPERHRLAQLVASGFRVTGVST